MPAPRRSVPLAGTNRQALTDRIFGALGRSGHVRIPVTVGTLLVMPARSAADEAFIARLGRRGPGARTVGKAMVKPWARWGSAAPSLARMPRRGTIAPCRTPPPTR